MRLDTKIGGNPYPGYTDSVTVKDAEPLSDPEQEGVLMVDDLNVTEYISNQLKPLIDRIASLQEDLITYARNHNALVTHATNEFKALTDRIKLLESITDQSCNCEGK